MTVPVNGIRTHGPGSGDGAVLGPWCPHCGHVHPHRPVALHCRCCKGRFCTSDGRFAYCTKDCRRFARKRQVMLATRRWRSRRA